MDGFFVNWIDSVAAALGVDPALARAANAVHNFPQALGLTKSQMWRAVDEQGTAIWENMGIHEDAFSVFEEARALHGDRVDIITAPNSPSSCAGKALWVNKHLDDVKNLDIIQLSRNKWRLAGPGRYLFDDSPTGCRDWESHPRVVPGGTAVLVPRVGAPGRAEALDRIRHIIREAV